MTLRANGIEGSGLTLTRPARKIATPAAEPLRVVIVERPDPNATARWVTALKLLLEAGREPEEAVR